MPIFPLLRIAHSVTVFHHLSSWPPEQQLDRQHSPLIPRSHKIQQDSSLASAATARSMTTAQGQTMTRTYGEARLLNRPALIEYRHMRFLVSDAPSDSNLALYISEFGRHHVKDVVRVCDPTYGTAPLEQLGIKVYDWPFGDGEGPPPIITSDWLDLVQQRFGKDQEKKPDDAIVVHCVAGLGRAPLLVAIALIEAGMTPEESIAYVRERRRGAFNSKQTKYVMDYKRRKSRKSKCTIM